MYSENMAEGFMAHQGSMRNTSVAKFTLDYLNRFEDLSIENRANIAYYSIMNKNFEFAQIVIGDNTSVFNHLFTLIEREFRVESQRQYGEYENLITQESSSNLEDHIDNYFSPTVKKSYEKFKDIYHWLSVLRYNYSNYTSSSNKSTFKVLPDYLMEQEPELKKSRNITERVFLTECYEANGYNREKMSKINRMYQALLKNIREF